MAALAYCLTLIGPIERIEMPGRPFSYLSRRIGELKAGESFVCMAEDVKEAARAAARRIGIKIQTQKVEDGWRVMRLS